MTISQEQYSFLQGTPNFKSCVKALCNNYDIELHELFKNDKIYYEGSNGDIKIRAIPHIEKGRINVDLYGKRLCEINTGDSQIRLAVRKDSPYLKDGDDKVQHRKKYFSYDEFYIFFYDWVSNILG